MDIVTYALAKSMGGGSVDTTELEAIRTQVREDKEAVLQAKEAVDAKLADLEQELDAILGNGTVIDEILGE